MRCAVWQVVSPSPGGPAGYFSLSDESQAVREQPELSFESVAFAGATLMQVACHAGCTQPDFKGDAP